MKDIVEMVKEMTTRVKTEDSKENIFVSQFDIITLSRTTTENICPVHMQYCNLCRIKKKIDKMKTRMSYNLNQACWIPTWQSNYHIAYPVY